jgi:phosphonate degradation associated HDIG domain protein
MPVNDEILALFHVRGAEAYFGESISTAEHALQAAHFAQAAGAPPALIVAALLHDVGHLIEDVPDDIANWATDTRHEEIGSRWLAQRFSPQVSEPVRLHVRAKRYLLATDPGYFSNLSPASLITLKLQGGPMSGLEVSRFESERFHEYAVSVRRWDDRGKVPGLATLSLRDYRALIEALVLPEL